MREGRQLASPRVRRLAPAKPDPIFGARPREELEFLPAALEVVETPAPPLPRMAALSLSALLFAVIGWACLGQVDIVSTAPGKLIPAGGGKVIQPLETARVSAIHVHDGQHVHRGDVLIELDPTETRSERDRLKGELSAEQLEVTRLQAVALGKAFSGPSGGNAAATSVARQEAAAERAELQEKLATLDHQIGQRRAEIAESEAQVARLQALLPIDQKATVVFQTLAKKGYGSTLQLLQAQEKQEDTARQLDVQRRKVPELDAEIAALQHQRAETAAETAKTALGELADAQTKAGSLQEQLTGAEEHLRTRTLTAPTDGTVQELSIHTIGGVVEPAKILMRVAPAGVGVEVEAKLPNKDVGFVRAGMPVAVKIETFPFTRYGVIRGQVTNVSDDAVSDKRPDGSEELTYLVRVRLERDTMQVGGRTVRLEPGMAVTAEVKTGHRRVIQFVLSPLAKAVGEAGRER